MATYLETQRSILENEISLKNQAIESSINAIALTDLNGEIIYINKPFLKLFDVSNKKNFLKNHSTSFWNEQTEAIEIIKNIHQTEFWSGEIEVTKTNGSKIITLFSANAIKSKAGKSIAIMISIIDISKEKELEKDLETIFNSINDEIAIFALDGHFLEANRVTFERLGYSKSELTQMSVMDVTPPEYRENLRKQVLEKLERGGGIIETVSRHKDGSLIPIELNIQSIEYKGKPAIITVARDTTDRKKAENALKASEEKYSNLVENGNDGIIIIQDNLLKYINQKFENMAGYSKDEILGRSFFDIVSEEDRDITLNRHKKRFTHSDFTNNYEIEILSKNGKRVPVEISGSIIDYEGRPANMAIIRDITERKKLKQKIRETDIKNEAILNALPDLIFQCNKEGTILDFRPSTEIDTYVQPKDFLDKNVKEVLPEDIAAKVISSIDQAIKTKELQRFYYELRTNRKLNYFEARVVLTGEDSTLAIISDITDRKLAEIKLKKSEEKYSALVENGNDGILIVQDDLVKYANSKMTEMVGYSLKEAIGSPFLEYVHENHRELVFDKYEKKLKVGNEIRSRYEFDILSKDGGKI
ncbi:PAS domain S-box protein [Methanococcoides sp. LMO-2]|uniref:PAS domain S-box protein n=1 Tax=Methanococcoides cohabitans TaxID=3136559 RepID=A0ABU9KS78_9EURY